MKWLVLAGVSAALALAAACDGGDETPAADTGGALTPVGTKDATPTPLATVTGAPTPIDPTLDEELTEIASGGIEAILAAGDSKSIDTAAIAGDASCMNFAFDFAWQVQDPHPPDGVDLVWQFTREAGTVEVANGPGGDQSVGCGVLEALNRGAGTIALAIIYRAGAIE